MNGTINVTNPDTVVLSLDIATPVSNGGYTIGPPQTLVVIHRYFSTNSGVVSANAPTSQTSHTSPGVQWHDMVTASPDGVGRISRIVDNIDDIDSPSNMVNPGSAVADLASSN